MIAAATPAAAASARAAGSAADGRRLGALCRGHRAHAGRDAVAGTRAAAEVERDRRRRRERAGARRHDQRLARRGVHPQRHARPSASRPAASGHAAAAGRRRLVACDRARRRFAARRHPPGAARDRHGELRHRARDAVPPPHADAGHGAQRRHPHRAGRRRRSRLPVAASLLLALRGNRRRRAGGIAVADAQPQRAGAGAADCRRRW